MSDTKRPEENPYDNPEENEILKRARVKAGQSETTERPDEAGWRRSISGLRERMWYDHPVPVVGEDIHWLIDKVEQQADELAAVKGENERLRIRLLSAAGDDLCRLTQEEIKELSSGAVKITPKGEFLASCERFHEQLAAGPGVLNECLTLAQLIAENERLTTELTALQSRLAEVEEKEKLAIQIYDEYRTLKPYGNSRGAIDADSVLKAHELMIEADNKRIATESKLAEVEAERNAMLITGGGSLDFDSIESINRLKQRAEAAERRVAELEKQLAEMTELRNHFAERNMESVRVRNNAIISQIALAKQLEAAERRVEELEAFARSIRDGYDHENDAHKYDNGACRKCNAELVLAATTPPNPEGIES